METTAVCLYSKYSQRCKEFLDDAPANMIHMLCIDKEEKQCPAFSCSTRMDGWRSMKGVMPLPGCARSRKHWRQHLFNKYHRHNRHPSSSHNNKHRHPFSSHRHSQSHNRHRFFNQNHSQNHRQHLYSNHKNHPEDHKICWT